jgi:hypothetical protein
VRYLNDQPLMIKHKSADRKNAGNAGNAGKRIGVSAYGPRTMNGLNAARD